MNIFKPDCGWDPNEAIALKLEGRNEPVEVTAEALASSSGFDLSNKTNMFVSLEEETTDVTITSLENIEEGKRYTLVATNEDAKHLQVIFPSDTFYQGTITPADGKTIVYEFIYIDGVNYCRREIFA